jgi:hypothetical protein
VAKRSKAQMRGEERYGGEARQWKAEKAQRGGGNARQGTVARRGKARYKGEAKQGMVQWLGKVRHRGEVRRSEARRGKAVKA